jgi:hypothetical protein
MADGGILERPEGRIVDQLVQTMDQDELDAELNRKYDEMLKHVPCWYAITDDDDLLFDQDPSVLRDLIQLRTGSRDALIQYIARTPPYEWHFHYVENL